VTAAARLLKKRSIFQSFKSCIALVFHKAFPFAAIVLSTAWSPPAVAQSPVFNHLGTAEGLNENNVSSCVLDRNGILWVGTFEGLNSYDGIRVIQYSKQRNPLLASNAIDNLLVDPRNRIWIRTGANPVNMLDENRQFRLYRFSDSADKIRTTSILYTRSKGLIAFKGNKQYYLENDTAGHFVKLPFKSDPALPLNINLTANVNGDTVFFYGNNKLVLYDYHGMATVMTMALQGVDGIPALNGAELIA